MSRGLKIKLSLAELSCIFRRILVQLLLCFLHLAR